MKRLLLLLAMTIAVTMGCSTSKTSQLRKAKDILFEYNAYTRGSSVNYKVTKDSIIQKEVLRGEGTVYKNRVDSDEWDALLSATEKVNLEKLEAIEVPSKKHQFDGAMAATLKITVNGKTYQSPTFDNDNPPAEIKEIIDNITVM